MTTHWSDARAQNEPKGVADITNKSEIPGEKLGVLKAVPTKRALRNDARKLGVIDAMAEIIDNAIDNFAKQEKLDRPGERLRIEISLNQGEVVIREDSGGVTPEDLLAFVQVGGRGQMVDAPRIGVWGAGQKLAVAALGNDVTISTRYWNERNQYEFEGTRTDQVILKMDDRWWADDQNWDVPVYVPNADLPSGETLYEIRNLNRRIDDDAIEQVVKDLENLYGDVLEHGGTTITINAEALKGKPRLTTEALSSLFAAPPGFEPSNHSFVMERTVPTLVSGEWKNVDRKLRMRVIVGLTPRQDQKNAGVHMFGVPETESGARLAPRWFAGPLQDESVGYSTGARSYLRKGHPTLGRLQMFVVFYGDSEFIPWGLPGSSVKRGYNSSNVFADEIDGLLKSVARPYARFTAKAREVDLVPYSLSWNEMSDAEKKSILRRGAYLKDPEDIDESDVAPRVRPLLRHEFKPSPLREWNHQKDSEEPPEAIPAFDDRLSKNVVSLITERDKRLHQLKGDDPVAAVETLMATLDELRLKEDSGWAEEDHVGEKAEGGRSVPVTVRIPRLTVKKLTELTKTSNRSEAVLRAVNFYINEGGD